VAVPVTASSKAHARQDQASFRRFHKAKLVAIPEIRRASVEGSGAEVSAITWVPDNGVAEALREMPGGNPEQFEFDSKQTYCPPFPSISSSNNRSPEPPGLGYRKLYRSPDFWRLNAFSLQAHSHPPICRPENCSSAVLYARLS